MSHTCTILSFCEDAEFINRENRIYHGGVGISHLYFKVVAFSKSGEGVKFVKFINA